MPAGLIVYIDDKEGNRQDFECDGSKEWDIPMVVLVDISSASASEIFTAAVKDTGVATVVGTKTYGKGVYQRVLALPDGSGVKLTAGRFYSPNGECFHDVGIEPDVKVEFDGEAYLADGTDNQLEKGIEVLKDKIKDAGK
jgi:carboxyl-terminal processing protease